MRQLSLRWSAKRLASKTIIIINNLSLKMAGQMQSNPTKSCSILPIPTVIAQVKKEQGKFTSQRLSSKTAVTKWSSKISPLMVRT